VVDHLGKPPFGGAGWERWRATLAAVAAHPNTTAKVSGLQVPGRPFTADAVRPAWDAALELFGPERLMWGSDWPLTVLVGGYQHAWEVMSSLVAELSREEQGQLKSSTATSVYKL
jgi:L-fuconolactonase